MKNRTVLAELSDLLERVNYTGPGKLAWELRPSSFAAPDQSCELTMTISWNQNGEERAYHSSDEYTFRLLEGGGWLEDRFQYQRQQLMRGLADTIVVGPRPLAVVQGGRR